MNAQLLFAAFVVVDFTVQMLLRRGGDVVVPSARRPLRGQALHHVHRHVVGGMHIRRFVVVLYLLDYDTSKMTIE